MPRSITSTSANGAQPSSALRVSSRPEMFDAGQIEAVLHDRNAAGKLCQPLLQLLLVIVGGGILDLHLDLADAPTNVFLLAAHPLEAQIMDIAGLKLIPVWGARSCGRWEPKAK
jgi:hypothetical protein